MKLKLLILFILFLNTSLFANHSVRLEILYDTVIREYTGDCANRPLNQFIGDSSANVDISVLAVYHNVENIKFSSRINRAIRGKWTSCSYKHLVEERYYIFTFTIDSCLNDTIYNPDTFTCEAPPPECTENELLNENNECVPLDSLMPENFPDDELSNGTTTTGTIPTTRQGCEDMERYNSSLGMVEVLGWDYQNEVCKVVAFKCNQGRVLDANTNKCIIPPDNAKLGGGDICPNDNWARRWTHDFCGQCVGTVGVWFPPLGHEESGMECNKAYVEYQCVKDYRIKKYVEVSCGDPLPTDAETREIDMSNLNETNVNDTNTSQLSDISQTDSTLKIAELLEKINTSVKSNNLDGVESKLTELINKSSNYGDGSSVTLDTTGIEEKLDSIDETAKEIKNSLDGKDKFGNPDKLDGQDEHFSKVTDILNLIDDGIVNIKDDYNSMLQKIQSGFVFNASVGSKTPLKATVFNKQIELDLCTPFQMVSSIFYYIFTLIFIILAIKLYWIGFKVSLGGTN